MLFKSNQGEELQRFFMTPCSLFFPKSHTEDLEKCDWTHCDSHWKASKSTDLWVCMRCDANRKRMEKSHYTRSPNLWLTSHLRKQKNCLDNKITTKVVHWMSHVKINSIKCCIKYKGLLCSDHFPSERNFQIRNNMQFSFAMKWFWHYHIFDHVVSSPIQLHNLANQHIASP